MTKNKCIYLIVTLLLLLSHGAAMAIPADPRLRSHRQPGGEILHYYVLGDEYAHFAVTNDGLPLVLDNVSNTYMYATLKDGKVVASNIVARDKESRTATELQQMEGLQMQEALLQERVRLSSAHKAATAYLRKAKAAGTDHGIKGKLGNYPTTGKRNSPVILIQFSDVAFSGMNNPKDYYTRMLNEKGFSDNGATGSASDYYTDNSNQQLDITFDVYGPVKVSMPHYYYGNRSAGAAEVLSEACKLLDAEIDFSQYDTDGDGIVDNIFYFWAGYGEADSGDPNDLWPCSWNLMQAKDTLMCDGKYIGSFACSNELRTGKNETEAAPTGIGTFVHEFGHVLGLPDMYDTQYNMLSFTSGYVDLMDKGSYANDSRTPPNLSGYERCVLGWATPKVLDQHADSVLTLRSIASGDVLQIKTNNPDENFFLENRQLEGWDQYLPLHGMLAWHVDYDSLAFNNNVLNCDYTHPRYDLMAADGKRNAATLSGDAFPGTEGITDFDFKAWDGTVLTPGIEAIEERNSLIRFVTKGGNVKVATPANVALEDVSQKSAVLTWRNGKNTLRNNVNVWQGKQLVASYTGIGEERQALNGLEPDTEYLVSVTSVAGHNVSDSASVTLLTLPLPFAERKLQALPATNVSQEGFTANWVAMKDAVDYDLYVNRLVSSETTSEKGYGFDTQAEGMPDLWETSSDTYSSVNGRYGKATPSLRFSADSDYLVAGYTDDRIEHLKFWYVSAKPTGKIIVESLIGGLWEEAGSITQPSTTGTTVDFDIDHAEKVRIRYERTSGYVTIDDVVLTTRGLERIAVEGCAPKKTGKVTATAVSGLAMGQYAYTLCGVNSEGVRSASLNEVRVDVATSVVPDTLTISYCDGELGTASDLSFKNKNDWGEAAVCFPKEALKSYAGSKIIAVNVGLLSRINLDSLKIWIRKDLNGENLVEHTITSSSTPRISKGWNVMELSLPMTITAKDTLYVGYSYKQRSGVSAISYAENPQKGALWTRFGSDGEWTDRSDKGALSVEMVVCGTSLPQYDLQMKHASVLWSTDGKMLVKATVRNKGCRTIKGFTLTAHIQDTEESFNSQFDNVLNTGEECQISFQGSSSVDGVGTQHPIVVSISQLSDGLTDENAFNNTLTADFLYKRHVLLEEFTTEQCVNCPAMAKLLHEVLGEGKYQSGVSMVAHHAGFYTDDFTQPCDNSLTWLFNNNGATYAPALMFDRFAFGVTEAGLPTPVLLASDASTLRKLLDYRLDLGSHVYMHSTVSKDGDKFNVSVEGGRSSEYTTPLYITVYVTENNVKAKSQTGATGEYYHQHVIRAYNSVWGDSVDFSGDNTFEYQWTFTLPDGYDADNVEVVALLAPFDENDPSACTVENATRGYLPGHVDDIDSASNSMTVKDVTYYTLDGRKLPGKPAVQGLYILRQTGADGRTVTSKEYVKVGSCAK